MYEPMLKEAFGEEKSFVDKETQGFFRLLSTHIKPQLFLKGSVVCRYASSRQTYFHLIC